MPSEREPDSIVRRIVVDIGRLYVYLQFVDGAGKLVDEDVFKQPFRIDKADAVEEAVDLHGLIYDHLNETINFPSASSGGESAESE